MSAFYKYILVLTGMLLMYSCTKDVTEPLPEENSPIFKVKGTLGNEEINLTAGEAGSFMKTQTKYKNNVKHFEGILENAQTKFAMSISEGMLDIPSFNSEIEDFETFKVAPYNYNEPLVNYSIQDFPNSEFIYSIEWSIDGQPQESSTLKIYEPGRYNLCASVTFQDGSQGKSCNDVIIGYQKNIQNVLRHILDQYANVIAFLDSPDESVSSIDWLVNDSLIASSSSENFKTNFNDLDNVKIGAHVSFQNGTYREKELFVDVENINNFIGDFTVMENQSTKQWDHTATIVITHNQKEYRAIQNSSNTASISIDEVTPFKNNSSGDEVLIYKGSLNCSFIDLSTQEKLDGEFEFSFGIAH